MGFLAPRVYYYGKNDATFEGLLRDSASDLGASDLTICNGQLCRNHRNGERVRK